MFAKVFAIRMLPAFGIAASLAGCTGSGAPVGLNVPDQSRFTSSYSALYSFAGGSDGAQPWAGLIDVNGTLYGTTEYGGGPGCGGSGPGCGTVFRISVSGGEEVMYSFAGGTDGAAPVASLIYVKGTLYGTTANGGGTKCFSGVGCGTIFRISTTGTEKVLHRFGGGSQGYVPVTGLIEVNGTLFGMTAFGGASGCFSGEGCGTVFRINTNGSGFKVLYRFAGGSDGADPKGNLIDVKGMLYGTTSNGGGTGCGGSGCGTVFQISPTGTEKVLYSFADGADGAGPNGNLVDVKGMLYGTAFAGAGSGCTGSHGCGSVFRITTTGSRFKVLYKFNGGADGAKPAAGLIDLNGTLYGTTYEGGGSYDNGTIFQISTTGAETVLHSFGGGYDGVNPTAPLLDVNGILYGTTILGGTSFNGFVFALTP